MRAMEPKWISSWSLTDESCWAIAVKRSRRRSKQLSLSAEGTGQALVP